MQIDTADLATLETSGQLLSVLIHEMAHAIGFGTIWKEKGLLSGAGGADPRFTGPGATAEYRALFGVADTSVPVEAEAGEGSRDSHWRESVFVNELMTPDLNPDMANPLSRITVASMADLGYTVNLNAADPYQPPRSRVAPHVPMGRLVALDGPITTLKGSPAPKAPPLSPKAAAKTPTGTSPKVQGGPVVSGLKLSPPAASSPTVRIPKLSPPAASSPAVGGLELIPPAVKSREQTAMGIVPIGSQDDVGSGPWPTPWPRVASRRRTAVGGEVLMPLKT
jgi:hypothetical protein